MFFVIHCLDHDGSLEKRMGSLDAHKAYVASSRIKIVISGPLLSDDSSTMIGSMFIVDVDSREEVIAFNEADPLYKAGVWKSVKIHAFNKRVDNR